MLCYAAVYGLLHKSCVNAWIHYCCIQENTYRGVLMTAVYVIKTNVLSLLTTTTPRFTQQLLALQRIVNNSVSLIHLHFGSLCSRFGALICSFFPSTVKPTVIDVDIFVNSIGPVSSINMVSPFTVFIFPILFHLCGQTALHQFR